MTAATYATYLTVSIAMTPWVAKTLQKSGRVFLLNAFTGNAAMADSVNQVLLRGFYQVNLEYVLLMLRMSEKPASPETAIEFPIFKQGFVLFVLGAMHIGDLPLLSAICRSRLSQERSFASVYGERDAKTGPFPHETAEMAGAAS